MRTLRFILVFVVIASFVLVQVAFAEEFTKAASQGCCPGMKAQSSCPKSSETVSAQKEVKGGGICPEGCACPKCKKCEGVSKESCPDGCKCPMCMKGQGFEKLDANQDGAISIDEWKGCQAGFAQLDKDLDCKLTPEEFKAFECKKGCEYMKNTSSLDKDNDGMISSEEWNGCPEKFKALDADQDGKVSIDEVKTAHKAWCKACKPASSDWLKTKFEMKDTNKDGVLSTEEWSGSPEKFKMLDADENGSISMEEMAAKYQTKMKAGEGCPCCTGTKTKTSEEKTE